MNIEIVKMKRPCHLWVVCIIFFLLFSGGVRDFLMILFDKSSYFITQGYNQSQIGYFTNYPLIPRILWGINIFTAIISTILLFFRSKYAEKFALIALLSLAVQQFISFGFMDRWNRLGTPMSLFDLGILVMTFCFYIYCRLISKKLTLK